MLTLCKSSLCAGCGYRLVNYFCMTCCRDRFGFRFVAYRAYSYLFTVFCTACFFSNCPFAEFMYFAFKYLIFKAIVLGIPLSGCAAVAVNFETVYFFIVLIKSKCIITYIRYTVRYRYIYKFRTIIKSRVPYTRHTVRYCNIC